MKKAMPANWRGFTLSEILLVVTIIAILAVFTLLSFQRQTIRGYDSKRKADLAMLKVLFEDYYNDHTCYPTKAQWDEYNCQTKANEDFLRPYLGGRDIPCDPQTNQRYMYLTIQDKAGGNCGGYRSFAELGNASDLDIGNSGCDPDPNKGCGYEPYSYNYGIAMGGTVANPEFDFSALVPTPTPGYPFGNWMCPPKIGNQPPQNCQYYPNSCRDLMITRGCATYDDANKYNCSALCNPGQTNVCTYLYECY